MTHKFSEEIIRHQALTEEGKSCEILERITFERQAGEGNVSGQLAVVNRRYDLRTGERVNRLSETEFEEDDTGVRLRLQR